MMCLPRSASASCSCVIRPESSLTADCTRFAASSCNRARSEASRCHPPPIPLLPQSITSLRQARPHEPRVSFDKIKSEEHTSELQSHVNLVCRLLLEKKKNNYYTI